MGIFATIADRIRDAVTKPRVRPGAAVVRQQPLWHQYDRIGGNLTPADVSAILQQADAGDPSRLVSLAHEARQKDGHLHSVLATREQALCSIPLVISPFKERGADEPTERDADIAAFVEDVLTAAAGDGQDLRSLTELVAHLNGAVYHGFSVAETAWRRDGRNLVIDGWSLIGHRRFRFRLKDGRLVWQDIWGAVTGLGVPDGVDLAREYPGQFAQHMPRVNGDCAAREGLSHLLVWPALFRNWSVADWMKLAELAWKPWRIGRLSKDAGQKDRDDLVNVLEFLTTNGIAVITANQELTFEWPSSGGKSADSTSHMALCDFMGAEMSKAVLGQTLTTEQGDRGARSLGEVHDRVRLDIRDNDAKAVAATIRRDIVAPLVALNFGDVPLPGVAFATEDAPDLGAFGDAIGKLKKAGMRIPRKWAHDQAGIPEVADDEEALGEDGESEVDVDTSDLDEEQDDAATADEEQESAEEG